MLNLRALLAAMSLAFAIGCGKSDDSPKKIEPCGNGLLDLNEICDRAITAGPGACPTECPGSDPCTALELTGSVDSCTAECVSVARTCGDDGDSCCPAGCSFDEDNDCAPPSLCGNGVLDGAETCDPGIPTGRAGACECDTTTTDTCSMVAVDGSPADCTLRCTVQTITACNSFDGCCPSGCDGTTDADCPATCGNGVVEDNEICDQNCPVSCDDGDACTDDSMSGSPSTCDADCANTRINACIDSDGCCPPGCEGADNDCDAICGNDFVEVGETCDGNCPTSCNDGDACTVDALVGAAATCDASCSNTRISACTGGDGCCPSGCTMTNDSDCVAACGNGIVEGGETCDQNCPTICDDGDACTVNVRTGNAATCDVQCAFSAITACVNGDGCCAPGCTAVNDDDCSASCGNGVVEAGETCDLNCPTACDDGDACTTDNLTGSAAACTAACANPPITMCVNGDGCCAPGCTFSNDDDCACVPDTCASLGLECGVLLDDGCGGGGEDCGTCIAGESCVSNLCELDYDVGDACVADGDCAGAAGICATEATTGWDGGYCVRLCTTDAECGLPNHCGSDGYCWRNCSSDADCRPGYQCYDADFDGQSECAPVATGAGAVGAPCTSYADCAGGTAGFCATAASGFNGGFCSRDCVLDTDCPAGSHCYDGQACVPNCTGAADCRGAGYSCFDGDADATTECFRFANGAGAVGASCAGLWDCAGGQWGWCLEPADGYVGGYCTVACGTGEGTCPNQTSCWFDGASDICMDNCQNTNQCRASYTCSNPGGLPSAVCRP